MMKQPQLYPIDVYTGGTQYPSRAYLSNLATLDTLSESLTELDMSFRKELDFPTGLRIEVLTNCYIVRLFDGDMNNEETLMFLHTSNNDTEYKIFINSYLKSGYVIVDTYPCKTNTIVTLERNN